MQDREGKELKTIQTILPLMERLWSRVDKTGDCWIWTGSKNNKGYGVIGNGNNHLSYVHRLVWEESNGTIPEGVEVCHSCDKPSCVRHLFLGSHLENMQDMARKQRSGMQRLSVGQVDRIIGLRKLGKTQTPIARETNIPLSTVKTILSGRSWSHHTGIKNPDG